MFYSNNLFYVRISAVFLTIFFVFTASGCAKKQQSASASDQLTVDFDFSQLDYEKAVPVLFDLDVNPEKYTGKVVKFSGQFHSAVNPQFGRRLYSVILYDPDGDCQTGLQFELEDHNQFPEDFPEEGDRCSVTGVFTTGTAGGFDYNYLLCKKIDLEKM